MYEHLGHCLPVLVIPGRLQMFYQACNSFLSKGRVVFLKSNLRRKKRYFTVTMKYILSIEWIWYFHPTLWVSSLMKTDSMKHTRDITGFHLNYLSPQITVQPIIQCPLQPHINTLHTVVCPRVNYLFQVLPIRISEYFFKTLQKTNMKVYLYK